MPSPLYVKAISEGNVILVTLTECVPDQFARIGWDGH